MAEAEEVITDVARHATVFTRDLWRRHRGNVADDKSVALRDVVARLDHFLTSVFGRVHRIRAAQAPAPPTLLSRLLGSHRGPGLRRTIPATDGYTIWLPPVLADAAPALSVQRYRVMALQQAMRAARRSADLCASDMDGFLADVFLLIEAQAADRDLVRMLPGMLAPVTELRRDALRRRPTLTDFPRPAQPLETLLRHLLQDDPAGPPRYESATPNDSLREARAVATDLLAQAGGPRALRGIRLLKDRWTGELLRPAAAVNEAVQARRPHDDEEEDEQPKSVRLERRPRVREQQSEDEDDSQPGPWMVQADEPHQKAEDPLGLQRPTDRDDASEANEMGEMLSELSEARLVATPGRPKEVLLSDDPPESSATYTPRERQQADRVARYPEWDYRRQCYREPGATIRGIEPEPGSQAWIDTTLREHRAMLEQIRRRFEMLRARRVVLRKQLDGDEIDFDRCVDAIADLRAGASLPERLYQRSRPAERSLAIMLLVDISGSTDGWVSSMRRVIDVEREALLLVCIALQQLGEPYAVQAFSGRGPHDVTVRHVKDFSEAYGNDVALRIASLEPEQYTRAGAAIRHATASLMQQPASDRLLLLLSDGKPNDIDEYEGQYGAEDMRQAVTEARLQGLAPFCLTIDRQAADYLPRIFGSNQYAMLPRPELLPTVLLDWMRRLLAMR